MCLEEKTSGDRGNVEEKFQMMEMERRGGFKESKPGILKAGK